MKNLWTFALISVLMILNPSCASSQSRLSKPLELRTLRIDPALDGFVYCGRVCDKTVIGICFSGWKQVCDHYKFSDKESIKLLESKGFVLKIRKML